MRSRRMFMCGNTTKGFFTYFDYLINRDEAQRIYCIKGGPGTGKSTLLKKIGSVVEDEGLSVEYIHCSSDCNSLDGIIIPEKKITLIDGTAPHIIDPVNPGAVDEIINLGQYWGINRLKEKRSEIIQYNKNINSFYSRAYKYLKAAKYIYDDINNIYSSSVDMGIIDIYACGIKNTELKRFPISNKVGTIRKGFASAISPQGIINYIDTLVDESYKVITIKGEHGTGTNLLIKETLEDALKRGLDVEVYYCLMDPANRIEHLLIPKANLALITLNQYHDLNIKEERIIDLENYLDRNNCFFKEEIITANNQILDSLILNAIETIKDAKKAHDELEDIYIRSMDFEKIDKVTEGLIKEILDN